MGQKRVLSYFFLVCLTAGLISCSTTPPGTPEVGQEPVRQVERRMVSFEDLPGWNGDDLTAALATFQKSCRVIGKQKEWSAVCKKAEDVDGQDTLAVRYFFESHFTPYQIINADGAETGLATGYYEPLLKGSRKRKGKFKTALYRQPDDLLVINLADAYPKLKGLRLRGKLSGKQVVPYETRAELEKSGKLAGKEIVWVDDVLDAFFLEIQGSGRVFIPDTGETIRLAYANQNGRPYRSIGRYLIDKGELKPGQASTQQIKQWLAQHPNRLREVLDSNPSYVFFKEEKINNPAEGPKGALGVPLTPERSIAVDPRHIPLGVPVFIDTTQPYSSKPMQKLVFAQDTGGAINGAVRADYFWGFGQQAGEMAGKMKQKLRIWLLLPKSPGK